VSAGAARYVKTLDNATMGEIVSRAISAIDPGSMTPPIREEMRIWFHKKPYANGVFICLINMIGGYARPQTAPLKSPIPL
jgi:hypothetical protein